MCEIPLGEKSRLHVALTKKLLGDNFLFNPWEVASLRHKKADVAELADALDSGSSGLIHMAVEVRPLSSALAFIILGWSLR